VRSVIVWLTILALVAGMAVSGQDEPLATLYVFTDRQAYAQGMVIVVNVLARDGEGIPLGGVEIYISMISPDDQLIFERVGRTFPNGSFTTYAVVPSDATEGYYTLDAVALVDIVPTPSATVQVLVCRLCAEYDQKTSVIPSIVTVVETEYIPLTTTATVSHTTTVAATTLFTTDSTVVTSVNLRSVTLTATIEVNPYSYIPGLAVLAFAGYSVTLLILRRYRVRSS